MADVDTLRVIGYDYAISSNDGVLAELWKLVLLFVTSFPVVMSLRDVFKRLLDFEVRGCFTRTDGQVWS